MKLLMLPGIGTRPLKTILASRPVNIEPRKSVTLASIWGSGYVNIVFYGDGDPSLRVRVYVDDVLDSEFQANKAAIVIASYFQSVRIDIYNPNDAVIAGASPKMEIVGMVQA